MENHKLSNQFLTKKILLILFFFVGFCQMSGWTQTFQVCSSPGQNSCRCETAPVICTINDLDGYTFQMSTFQHPMDGPTPMCNPMPAGSGGTTANNPSWLGFVAWCEEYTFELAFTNCTGGESGLDRGIQAAIYSTCIQPQNNVVQGGCAVDYFPNCNCGPTNACTPNCFGCGVNNGTRMMHITGLTIGSTYYLMVDGCAGSACSVTINVMGTGGTCMQVIENWPGQMVGPTTVKQGDVTEYSAKIPKGGNKVTVRLDGTGLDVLSAQFGSDSVKTNISWPNPGIYTLCFDAYNACVMESSAPSPLCLTVAVECDPKPITSSPTNQTKPAGQQVKFGVAATGTNVTYQWQSDIGFGFQNLSNAGQYSGVNTDSLVISQLSLSNHNQLFRCIVNAGPTCKDTSATAVLSIGSSTPTTPQVPQLMSYQAVLRDGQNKLLKNQNVGLLISIHQGDAAGPAVFSERHSTSTNANGLFSLEIGAGTAVSGSFSTIDWAEGPYFVKTLADPTGGTNYTLSGSRQLLSVPYALYAQSSGSGQPGPQGAPGPQGMPGPQGVQGVQGPIGLQGEQGIPGPQGEQGPQGVNGTNGVDGVNGKSAYEIAVENGFVGTESQWLVSLKGEKGTSGDGLIPGTETGQMLYWNGSSWVQLAPGTRHQVLTMCDGVPLWTPEGICPGQVGSMDCNTGIQLGVLMQGFSAQNVSSEIQYTSGNGGFYIASQINSTGVIGLTASIEAGRLNVGSGTILVKITGKPTTSGIAYFEFMIGGVTCTMAKQVSDQSGVGFYPPGYVHCGDTTLVVDVYNPITGRIWMDRNLGAKRQAQSYNDVEGIGDLFQWGRFADGHQCRNSNTTTILSSIDKPTHGDFIIGAGNWRSPNNNNLWQGVNGTNNPCPIGYRLPTNAEFNAERSSWNSTNFFGAFSSVLKLTLAGNRSFSAGDICCVSGWGYYITSDNTGGKTSEMYIDGGISGLRGTERGQGSSVRCIKEVSGTIGGLDCQNSILSGSLVSGISSNGVSINVPYSSGNGGFYPGQNIMSSGVTGLIATFSFGTFSTGSGNLTLIISGTPSNQGLATFEISIGGRNCTLQVVVQSNPTYPDGTVHCNGTPTEVVEVTNPITGKTWMDRNLGASRVATSHTDTEAYGDLYQWGRGSDGHQCRNSGTTTTLSNSDQPGHGNRISVSNSPGDWRSPQNPNLWQGVNGTNNPCPNGYRLPTETELMAERNTWPWPPCEGAFSSPLKLPTSGLFACNGYYWSQTVSGIYSKGLIYDGSGGIIINVGRAENYAVRCIKD